MKVIKLVLVYLLLIFIQSNAYSQSLPVGTKAIEDYYRRQQMLGTADTTVSFTVRPIYPGCLKSNTFFPGKSTEKLDTSSTWTSKRGKLRAVILPFSVQTEANSNHPYGWNDGAMIPSKGLQSLISGGFFVKYGIVTLQLRPELVLAQNTEFSTFDKNQFDVIYARYYDIYNNIDLPVRFGTSAYSDVYWGQSSLRVNYKSISAGISTENLWWGPGIRNSLLMSNTAPGFTHLVLNTLKPIHTPVGSFEGMIIAGRLANSGFPPLEPDKSYFGTDLYVPKPNDWRYLSGYILTWQPKWVSGLFLGIDQTQQMYGKNINGITDVLPFFSQVKKTAAPDNSISSKDQLSSMFMRWLWPQEHAEIYFEYGNYNNTQDYLQTLLNPNESRAYIFGVRKLLPFKQRPDENILLGVEVTQLQGTSITKDIQGQEWYVSQNIRQGYTNHGQELGAGVGPGGNLQSVEVSWVKGLKKIGLQFERYVHDNDFYYYAFQDSKDYTRHWVDLTMGFNGEWNYKNLIFNAQIGLTNSLDYQWGLSQPGDDVTFAHQTHQFNLQLQTGITYRF